MTLLTEAESERTPTPSPALPTLLVFGCEESPCCRAMQKNLDWFAERHTGHLTVTYTDVWDDPQTSVDHEVLTVPTMILEIAGQETARLRGYTSRRKLILRLEPLLYDDLLQRIHRV